MHQPIRLPIYHCTVTSEIVHRLVEAGIDNRLAAVITSTDVGESPRTVFGPDLETLSPSRCNRSRCEGRCKAGFVSLMEEYGLDASLPEE